jgi:hypothetical protein
VGYHVREDGEVTLKFYNQTGRLVDTVKEYKTAGWQHSSVDISQFASGVYYFLISARESSGEHKQGPGKFVVAH